MRTGHKNKQLVTEGKLQLLMLEPQILTITLRNKISIDRQVEFLF